MPSDAESDRTISAAQAQRFYDRLGSWLDTQRFYEDRAIDTLVAAARFETARSVFEFGCGTGRLAARLLAEVLPADARYTGVDISTTMVRLTTARLRPWDVRATARLTDGSARSGEPDASHDRYVSTYVLDLLSHRDIRDVVADAQRIVVPDGRLCVVTSTPGRAGLAHLVTMVWTRLHARNPLLVGGCRPLHLAEYLPAGAWRVEHHQEIVAFGMSSEVTVAAKQGHPALLAASR